MDKGELPQDFINDLKTEIQKIQDTMDELSDFLTDQDRPFTKVEHSDDIVNFYILEAFIVGSDEAARDIKNR